ncbi:MAG TPA: hypothetical protein VF950_08115 [Planctomycetota bacterium]
MTPAEFDQAWQSRTAAIQDRAEEGLKGECRVDYGVYELDAAGFPVDNLDQVAVEGRCRLIQKHDPFFGEGADYRSEEVVSPTWKVVFALANDMVGVTGDLHHGFLEGVNVLREEGGVKIVAFEMGS